jgi:hypothetical protein
VLADHSTAKKKDGAGAAGEGKKENELCGCVAHLVLVDG